jgi:hypothetical protein
MTCKNTQLATTFEEYYKDLLCMGLQPGYRIT